MSIQSPSSSDPLMTQSNPIAHPTFSQSAPLTMTDIGSSSGSIKVPLTKEMEAKTPMQNILDIAAQRGFTSNCIKNVHVTFDKFDYSSTDFPEGETVDTWTKDGKIYAKMPMNYRIEFDNGNQNLEIEFTQPHKSDIEVPIGGTPRQISQFNQKIEAIAFGIRADIQAPILSKDRERIDELAKEHIPKFKFKYGDKGYLQNKKITWNKREKLDAANEQREIVGVEIDEKMVMKNVKYEGNVFNKIFQIWYDPYKPLSDSQKELLFGRPGSKAPEYPSIKGMEDLRKECAKKSQERLRNASNQASGKGSALSEYNSILSKNTNPSHRIDSETLLQQEAKSAQEEILDIDDFFNEHVEFKKDKNVLKAELKEFTELAALQRQHDDIMTRQKYLEREKTAFSNNLKIINDLHIPDENGQDLVLKDNPIDEKLYSTLSGIYSSLKDNYDANVKLFFLQPFSPSIRTAYQQLEQQLNAAKEAFEYASTSLALNYEKDKHVNDKQAYTQKRNALLEKVAKMKESLENLEGRIATVDVLSNESSLKTRPETKKSVKNLEALRAEKKYDTFKDKFKILENLINVAAPALPPNPAQNAPLALNQVDDTNSQSAASSTATQNNTVTMDQIDNENDNQSEPSTDPTIDSTHSE